ncbi:hypothetical protein F975_02416 [Acinetobacter sp. ANC 3789]|uniref:hypothetical protein n=1 Tax=Acinetobacter sp. ANC 3789 TaxID=1217714 RepID=UPI0002CF482E|nr:hypothetical protein [Acinetobacter sp. ANC 3789]ENU79787.1 hypothetical protein F975_02416 [Acinetobacter sp. ANC 3789]
MKTIIKDLGLLVAVWAIAVFLIASCSKSAYAVDLSKLSSVTPQRHCGFIVPKFCIGSQSMHETKGASITAMHTRLQSLYEGMTRQNKVLPNMSGGSTKPRVNPLTLISQISVNLNSKLVGGITHA